MAYSNESATPSFSSRYISSDLHFVRTRAVGVIVSMVMLDNDLASLFTLRYIKTLFVLIIASADLTETHLRYHRCALSLIAVLGI